MDTRFHFIRECVDNGNVGIDHVCTGGQLADILSEALGATVKFVKNWE
jgi:hypothetical protein